METAAQQHLRGGFENHLEMTGERMLEGYVVVRFDPCNGGVSATVGDDDEGLVFPSVDELLDALRPALEAVIEANIDWGDAMTEERATAICARYPDNSEEDFLVNRDGSSADKVELAEALAFLWRKYSAEDGPGFMQPSRSLVAEVENYLDEPVWTDEEA